MGVRIRAIPDRRLYLALQGIQRLTRIAGLCALSWPLFVPADSLWAQRLGERQMPSANLVAAHETIVVREPGSSRSPFHTGDVLGHFDVPRLKLSYVLLEGTDDRTLDKSIGHVEGTGLPGESGNIAIAGHRNTHFRKLEWIRRGDEIVLTSPHGQYHYRVEWALFFHPGDIAVLDAAHGPAVTLITCFPFEYVGSAPLRYVIRALPDVETQGRLSPMTSKNETLPGQ